MIVHRERRIHSESTVNPVSVLVLQIARVNKSWILFSCRSGRCHPACIVWISILISAHSSQWNHCSATVLIGQLFRRFDFAILTIVSIQICFTLLEVDKVSPLNWWHYSLTDLVRIDIATIRL